MIELVFIPFIFSIFAFMYATFMLKHVLYDTVNSVVDIKINTY